MKGSKIRYYVNNTLDPVMRCDCKGMDRLAHAAHLKSVSIVVFFLSWPKSCLAMSRLFAVALL